MKTIGILGGMSWESTICYYKLLNEGVRNRLGGLHSCKLMLQSVDFYDFAENMKNDNWDTIGADLSDAARNVEAGGADCILIATNTMHKMAETVQQAVDIPLLHMADAIAQTAKSFGVSNLGLLGTAFTMEQDFLKNPLQTRHNLNTIVPDKKSRNFVHQSIFEELCCGLLQATTRDGYVEVMQDLEAQGAEAIVLGCTEIGLLVTAQDVPIPLIDSVQSHVDLALEFALA